METRLMELRQFLDSLLVQVVARKVAQEQAPREVLFDSNLQNSVIGNAAQLALAVV
jgi:hypothetical protein